MKPSHCVHFRQSIRRILPVLIGLLWLAAGGSRLLAVSASPAPIKVTQADGTTVKLRLKGDEYFHWLEDAKGYTVLKVKEGKYVYATRQPDGSLAPTTLLAGHAEPQLSGLKPGLLPSVEVRQQRVTRMALATGGVLGAPAADGPQRITPNGTVKNLVILCRFSDHTAAHGRTQAEYETIFNAVGGHEVLAPTGSVRDYYTENSYGTMTLESTVVAWVTLPQTEAYYGAGEDGLGDYPRNAQRMAEDALKLADALVNFGEFDKDNNGFVDAIDIIHSGYGAETGGGDGNWIWSHKWALATNWSSADNNSSGVKVKVRDYHSEPALWGTSGDEILRIGVICHETGHFFGLPDLYDSDYTSRGIGSWCLMANSWGFDGTQRHPPHFSAWCKVQLGWVAPTVITSGTFTAPRVQTTPTIYKIMTGFPAGEYLLVENRQPYGFDDIIPAGGLCIWHIDEAQSSNQREGYPGQSGWPANNNHYKVALLQADGEFDLERGIGAGDAGDVFHAAGVSAITPATVPNTGRYQGGVVASTSNLIDSISVSGLSMTFSLNPPPTAAPVITSPVAVIGNTGSVFTYQITATNYPASYSASGVPAGLTFTASTGVISGTPTATGVFNMTVGATNILGTGNATVELTVTNLSVGVGNALETPGRAFVFTGSSANWKPQSATTHDGEDAIESGDLGDGGNSKLETTITGPVNVNFWQKISSEEGYDYLRFYVDGVMKSEISGEVDWTLFSVAVGTGSHVLRWEYTKDSSISDGADVGWVDSLELTPITEPPVVISTPVAVGFLSTEFRYQIAATNAPASYNASGLPAWLQVDTNTGFVSGTPTATGVFNFTVFATNGLGTGNRPVTVSVTDPLGSLPDALDVTGLTFGADGATPWYRQTEVTYDGTDAAENADIEDNGLAVMTTNVVGPGTVSFAWKISSEPIFDYLLFYVDDEFIDYIDGEVDWKIVNQALTAGPHVLRWEYSKDNQGSEGEDRAWVDVLKTNLPVITSPLAISAYANEAFYYQVASFGATSSVVVTGLPDGLTYAAESGLITGIPTAQGLFSVTLSASNASGTINSVLKLTITPPTTVRRVLLPWNETWKYFQPMGTFPSPAGNFASTWFANEATFLATYTGPEFGSEYPYFGTPSVPSSFDSGIAEGPIGYENIDYFNAVGAEFTDFGWKLVRPNAGNRRTAYLRTTFFVSNPVLVRPRLRYVIDDGAFIYVDGQLVATVNMPAGAVDSYTQLATQANNTESRLYDIDLTVPGLAANSNATIVQPVTSLAPGLHTIAVSVRSNDASSSDIIAAIQFSAESAPPEPDIAVLGGATGNVAILTGDATPATSDGTDFGVRSIASGPFDVSFSITNTGSASLSLGTIASNSPRFTIVPGYAATLAGGGSTLLTVRFNPQEGSFSGVISIPSNDSDENPFTYTVKAVGSTGGPRQTLVPWNHAWKYYHPMGSLVASPGNFLTTWYAGESVFASTYTGPPFGATPAVTGNTAVVASYDSGTAPGPLGYELIDYFSAAGSEFQGFGKQLTQPVAGNRRAAYLRTTFTVPAGGLTKPILRYLMDDGGFIYLDGVLVCAVNMPAGATDAYNQFAANFTDSEAFLRTVDLTVTGAVVGGNAVVVQPITTLSPGVHTLAVSVRSNSGTNSSDLCAAVELTAEASGSTSATASIGAGANDAEESATGVVNLTGAQLELINDAASGAGDQLVGLRFTGLAIPPGALITSATIQFKASEAQTGATVLTIAAEAADSAGIFTNTAQNLSARPATATSVLWQPPAWTVPGEQTAAQRTPNLAAVVQEIVSRPGWASGNAIAFLVKGAGRRTVDAFDKSGGVPASLSITYTSAANASYAQWIATFPGVTGNNVLSTANPDGDIFNNLLEYALATNPTQGNAVPYSISQEGGYLVFTYTRPSLAPDLTYSVEWCDTLGAANYWSPSGVAQQVISDDGTTRTVRAYVPAGGAKLFLHLRVTGP